MPFPSFFRLLLVGVLAVAVAFVKQVLRRIRPAPARLFTPPPRQHASTSPTSMASRCGSQPAVFLSFTWPVTWDGWLMAMLLRRRLRIHAVLTPLFSLHLPVLPLGTTLRRCIRLAARESASFSTCFPAPPRLIATHPLGIKTNQKRDGRSSRKPGTFGPLARY